jgi:hypothetical protein
MGARYITDETGKRRLVPREQKDLLDHAEILVY